MNFVKRFMITLLGLTTSVTAQVNQKDLGRVGELSAKNTLVAMKEVTKGKVYSLAVVTSVDTPTYGDRTIRVEVFDPQNGAVVGSNMLTVNNDSISGSLGVGTQIDGFGHIGINGVHWNGADVKDIIVNKRLVRFGTHDIPPIVTRGVLLDIAALKGKTTVEPGEAITIADINAAQKRQRVLIQPADVVIFHTGWEAMITKNVVVYATTEPGINLEAAKYLASLGVVAVGADTNAVEVIPFEKPEVIFPVHQELLAKNGIHILETIHTQELAAEKIWTFMFVLAAPRFEGAVQMVAHPIAIK